MADQLSFGSVLQAPSRPVETSQAAARKVTPHLSELRRKVLHALLAGPRGADRIAGDIGQHWIKIRPRLSELQNEGLVEPYKENGKVMRCVGALGNPQTVMCLTALGREEALK